MPIYEFYCEDCHTIFNFFSRRVNTEKIPACPRCHRAGLQRRASLFAVSRGRRDEDDEGMPDLDEERMERTMMELAGEMEDVDEDNPREAARLIRRLYDATGMQIGGGMEEAIRRMEAGEDPERIEEEMGDVLETEDPFLLKGKAGIRDLRRRLLPPRVDETLYDL